MARDCFACPPVGMARNDINMLYRSNNTIQTFNLGKQTATSLHGGDILTLSGELGAGKTVFIKGLASGFDIKQTVRSPSFNLMKIYKLSKQKKMKQFVHLDCYRLKNPTEIIDIGLFDYLGRPDTVCAIEWPEKIAKILKKFKIKKIKITTLNTNERKIQVI